MHTRDCQPLYREILKFYKTLNMPIEQEIPMLLVERPALNNAREVEKDVSYSCSDDFFYFRTTSREGFREVVLCKCV